ncbi:MAG: S41 family peptidase [Proteobacteria bacterium]|nr:S41 family peptidase [Pseudomonadota bacterium]
MKRDSPARATVIVTTLFLAGLMCGSITGAAAVSRAKDPYAGLELFAKVLTTIERDYVDEITMEDLIEAGIEGMVDELDPHSRWLSADQTEALKSETEGRYSGIGIEVRTLEDSVLVTRVLPNSPAFREGIEAGDRIFAIDGHSLGGHDIDEVEELFQGVRGEAANLLIQRQGWDEPQLIGTVRDHIQVSSVEAVLLNNQIAYIRLLQFQEGAARELQSRLEKMEEQIKLKGLILDLRDNPGGLLDQAVAVADLFLDEGVIVSTRSRLDGSEAHNATKGGLDPSIEVVVLINGGSASASEIVASALQETGRALLVGTPSYGKGSVQSLFRNPDNSALKLTTGRYFTPSGKPVAPREGRKPDFEVHMSASPSTNHLLKTKIAAIDITDEERAELLRLVATIPEPLRPDLPVDWDAPPTSREDPPLAKAIDVLTSH